VDLWQATEVARAKWRIEIWDTMIRVSRYDYQIGMHRNTQRGDCGLWSKRSRLNLLRYINRIDWEKINKGMFVTLTYPDGDMSFTKLRRTRDRSHFVLSLERQLCEELPIIWRTEFEERKSGKYTGRLMPHHHLMVLSSTRFSQTPCLRLWRNCLQTENPNLQVKVTPMKGAFGCAKYLAKYISKYRCLDIGAYLNTPCEFGRQWGVLRPSKIPMQCSIVEELTGDEKIRAAEMGIVVGLGDCQNIPSGYTIFGREMAEKIISRIFHKGD